MLILNILKDLQIDTILHIVITSCCTFGWCWLWLHVQLLAVSTRHIYHSSLWITRYRLWYRKMSTNLRLITTIWITKTINTIYSILKRNIELVIVTLVVWWWTCIICLRLALSIKNGVLLVLTSVILLSQNFDFLFIITIDYHMLIQSPFIVFWF